MFWPSDIATGHLSDALVVHPLAPHILERYGLIEPGAYLDYDENDAPFYRRPAWEELRRDLRRARSEKSEQLRKMCSELLRRMDQQGWYEPPCWSCELPETFRNATAQLLSQLANEGQTFDGFDIRESKPAGTMPPDAAVAEALSKIDVPYIVETWGKALERRTEDPEGAITTARTLLESVCKSILDELKMQYGEDWDLPKLYRLVAKNLELSPDAVADDVLKRTFGGCQSVVEGVGALRNRVSDSHGKGKEPIRAEARHAELAVNLPGSMAKFLVETYRACRAG